MNQKSKFKPGDLVKPATHDHYYDYYKNLRGIVLDEDLDPTFGKHYIRVYWIGIKKKFIEHIFNIEKISLENS